MRKKLFFCVLISIFFYNADCFSKSASKIRGGQMVFSLDDEEKHNKQTGLNEALYDAIQNGDDAQVQKQLKAGADPKALIDGMDALFLAVYLYHDQDHRKGTKESQLAIIKLLVEAGANYKRTFLQGISTLEFVTFFKIKEVIAIFKHHAHKKIVASIHIMKAKKIKPVILSPTLLDKIITTLLTCCA